MIGDYRYNQGFALLMAVLTGSVLLAIGLAILSITYKELVLSSTIRNSHKAFYAADTGIECARYFDNRNTFATSSLSNSLIYITCGGSNVSVQVVESSPTMAQSEFEIEIDSSDICAKVLVTKELLSTVIESRGYNTCVEDNPRRVERGLRLSLE